MNCNQPFEKVLENLIDEIAEFSDRDIPERRGRPLERDNSAPDLPPCREDYLDELRLYVKYLLFDLDATRRENTYMKKLLEKRES